MPRPGYVSVSIKESLYKELDEDYKHEKTMLAREGVGSLSGYLTKIVLNHLKDRDQGRLRHFNIYENVVRIEDTKIERLVDVDYRNGEMFCGLCDSAECIHTGFAWGVYRQYRALHTPDRHPGGRRAGPRRARRTR